MKSKSAEKVRLTSFDDLFGANEIAAGELTEGKAYAVLVRKEKENVNVTISAKKIRNYFPVEYSREQIEDVIYTLLEEWKQKEGGILDAGNTV